MQTLSAGYTGFSTLLALNWDRLFFAAAIIIGLAAGSVIGSNF